MLASSLSWARPPAFPMYDVRNRYALAATTGTYDFLLDPARSFFYRDDIARILRCAPRELFLRPGTPRPVDVSVLGSACHTIVAALDVGSLPLASRPVVCLLDARQVLRGWIPVLSAEGWIDAHPLLGSLQHSVPDDWQVSLVGFPIEQQWIYAEPGQILTATCCRWDAASALCSDG